MDENEDVSVTVTLNGLPHDKYRKFPSGKGSLDAIGRNLSKIRKHCPGLWKRIGFIANVAPLKELLGLRAYYMEHIGKPPLLVTGILAYGCNEKNLRIFTAGSAVFGNA